MPFGAGGETVGIAMAFSSWTRLLFVVRSLGIVFFSPRELFPSVRFFQFSD